MKLDGEYRFEASVQDVWDALFDPEVLAAALPGCEKLERVDGSYVGDLKVKVGPIQGTFTGKVDLLELNEPVSYRMIVDGRGPQGFVKANATISLAAEGAATQLRYQSEAQVGGKIASVGQRLIETSARAIVKQSLEGLHDNIKLRVAAHRAAAAVVAATTVAPATVVAPAPPSAEPVATPEPALAPAPPPPPTAAAASPPVVRYQKADAGMLAATVAKEVSKTLAPVVLGVLVVVALITWVLVR